MTPRQARRERREAKRKFKKAEMKKAKSDHPIETPAAAPAPPTPSNGSLPQHGPYLLSNRAAAEAFYASTLNHPAELDEPASQPIGFVPKTALPSSARRVEANRANAQHSTGPRTPGGKLTSSQNSTKHGLTSSQLIIPGEDPAEFEALLNGLLEEHGFKEHGSDENGPASPTEHLLIKEMAQSHWLAQRALRLQNECFTAEGVNEKQLALFLRYGTTHQRNFDKALNTLLRLQKERARARRGFVSQLPASPAEFVQQNPPDLASLAGFVSQTASKPEVTGSPKAKVRAA